MATYLDKAKDQLNLFSTAPIKVIPQSKNSKANAFVKLASTRDIYLLDAISAKFLAEPSIHPQQGIMKLTQELSWMNPIVAYLKTSEQPRIRLKIESFG